MQVGSSGQVGEEECMTSIIMGLIGKRVVVRDVVGDGVGRGSRCMTIIIIAFI